MLLPALKKLFARGPMLRQILIVHSSETVVNTVRRAINANINDALVLTADTVEQAVETVKMFNIHLTLYFPSMSDKRPEDIFHEIQPRANDQTVPMLFLADGESCELYQGAYDSGVSGCLSIPCDPIELCKKIEQICPPQRLRGSRRYSFSGTEVLLSQGGQQMSGRVVNISDGGVLCQLEEPLPFNWNKPLSMALTFNVDEKQTVLSGIEGVTVNLNVMRSNADYSPAQVRVAFRFIELPQGPREQMAELFANHNLQQRLATLTV